MKKQKQKKIRFDLSLWVAVSAIAVLAVLLALMSIIQFQERKNQAVAVFVEKGATLIQSFEAGLRNHSERFFRQEDSFYLQKLLMETAQQPDIDYMIITDSRGVIVADSDPSMLGRQYGLDLDTQGISGSMEIRWRQAANPDGAGTFEVYRGFSPDRNPGMIRQKPSWVVFVGFNMEKIEKASRQDTIRMIIRAFLLVLFGSLAIVSLFLVQSYRLTRASLSQIRVFSDALVKNIPIALLAVDNKGKVLTCNAQAQGFVRASCRDAVGKDAAGILPDTFLQTLDKAGSQTGLIAEDVVMASDHEEMIWEVIVAAFSGEDIQEGKILLARNVTDVRRMEQEVAKSRHLNAIGSLAAGVAHEIRNPLSSIKGFAVYFKGRLKGNPDDEETADIMIAETERLNRVISQLIEFARPLDLKKEFTNLEELARQTAKLLAADAKNKSVEIEVQAGKNLPQAPVDPDQFKQVLLNIGLNALAAMPEGGKLTITFTADGHALHVEISDTGEGIEEEDLPRIYDPYFTSKPAGTGLGLAVVQKIMEAHGGSVRIESKVNAGTTVMLRVPLDEAERKTI